MSRNGLIIDWERFKESVMNRWPIQIRDPQGAMSQTCYNSVSLRTTKARFDDQAAPVAGTSAGLEANKVVNDGDDSESSDVESTYDNDARDQVSELEMKVLVDGKQDEAKVVKVVVVAVEQNIDEPDVERYWVKVIGSK
ncbi:hypothetical protein Tco_0486528 [Tanacetum coccineum]